MTAVLVTAMLVIANIMGAGMAYPQAARLVRQRNSAGVSGVWAGVSLSMNLWWMAYGLAEGLWGLVPVSAVAAVLYGVTIVAYVRAAGRTTIPGVAAGLFVLGIVPLPVLLVGGWRLAGLAIGLCYGMQLVPAVVAACRSRELEGLAPSTWIMAWIEAVIWLAYGAVVLDPALLAGGISGTVMSAVILTRLTVTGHRPFRIVRPGWAVA
ncbi:MAG: hypothetical protein P8O03_15600 [Ilumatobacter sp.]|nr:hypothetical protein [Ilumatobacter sp.]MDG2040913.1 hypothetical protein [Ilumatobacter sp.]